MSLAHVEVAKNTKTAVVKNNLKSLKMPYVAAFFNAC